MTAAADEPLLYMPGATAGTTQWKVEALQLIQWGGFHGHTRVEFAPTVTLLSGASGTGKSTLLDAYIALLMDSNTPFNGASNDATKGRARNPDQRSLTSYIRGKLDDGSSNTTTGELADLVLRGEGSATWGALAVTFIDDRERRYTVSRFFHVQRGATKDSDLTRKMATIEGTIDLRDLEPFVADRFDKRAIEARFPNLKVHDTYTAFAHTFSTRLGIGAGGDGTNALRLLAKIQAGHQVSTVDDLYKTLVLERPATYEAADAAVDHFKHLEDAYDAMEDEAKKEKVLAPIPTLWEEREEALTQARLIDTFGLSQKTEYTPFRLWKLRTEDQLLDLAEQKNREDRTAAHARKVEADGRLADVQSRLTDVNAALDKNDANATLDRIDADINRLRVQHTVADSARSTFDTATARLDLNLDSEDDFAQAQKTTRAFLDSYAEEHQKAKERYDAARDEAATPLREKRELINERDSLANREGRMDPRLHRARETIAAATGLSVQDLPFVGELIDVLPDEKKWRKAIETTLFTVARVMLVDAKQLERVSKQIDDIDLKHRINFEGIDLAAFTPQPVNGRYVSGKLAYKDTPFTNWVHERITADSIDALCVESPSDLSGAGRRVTINGQTRRGRSGAHGSFNAPYVIGFSKEERLAEIATRLNELESILEDHDKKVRAADDVVTALVNDRIAHEHVANTTWRTIDADGILAEIQTLQERYEALRDSDETLKRLKTEQKTLEAEHKEASGRVHDVERTIRDLGVEQDRLIRRKDPLGREIERYERSQQVELTDEQGTYLDAEYRKVAKEGVLDDFGDGVERLRRRLGEQLTNANQKVNDKTRELEGIFDRYLETWKDEAHNLTRSIENYPSFRRIYDNIIATGLAERRHEWSKRLTDWSGQDLVPLAGAYSMAIEEIRRRLDPINDILRRLPFGARDERLRIDLRELHRDDIQKFKRELNKLARADTTQFTDQQVQNWFKRLRKFMGLIRKDTTPTGHAHGRDYFLDVNRHIEITAVAYNPDTMVDRATFAALGGKSGGETQELVAFIVGAALRFQLGDDANERPRFAPVFLDEGFIKADSDHSGRAVAAWKELGFQLIIGTPHGQFSALEPHADQFLYMTKSAKHYSHVKAITPTDHRATADLRAEEGQPA